MQQIFAYRMAPALLTITIPPWIVLEEQMPLAVVVDEAIRIIQPVLAGGEVELGALSLVITYVHIGREGSAFRIETLFEDALVLNLRREGRSSEQTHHHWGECSHMNHL